MTYRHIQYLTIYIFSSRRLASNRGSAAIRLNCCLVFTNLLSISETDISLISTYCFYLDFNESLCRSFTGDEQIEVYFVVLFVLVLFLSILCFYLFILRSPMLKEILICPTDYCL